MMPSSPWSSSLGAPHDARPDRTAPPPYAWRHKLRRIRALVLKEARQIVRDPSSIAIGVVLPLILILLFGYGLSLDVKNVPIAVVIEYPTPEAMDLAAGFQLSPYFHPSVMRSMPPAQRLLLEHRVDGIVRIPADFSRHFAAGDAEVQLIVHGGDANRARIIEGYVQGVVGIWAARLAAQGSRAQLQLVNVQARLWFNEANDSSYFLVPGLVVLVMTLIGGLLTAMVMAREWERGTLESLLVTPVRSDEILLGKTLPYFVLALFGFVLCVLSAKFLFHVPLRGSMWVLFGASMLYVLVALGIGLADLVLGQEPAGRQPAHDARHLHARIHAVGISVRSAQHADGGAPDHLCTAGALLRGAAAERVSRGRCLVGHRPEHAGAGGDGRRARRSAAAPSCARAWHERHARQPAAHRWP